MSFPLLMKPVSVFVASAILASVVTASAADAALVRSQFARFADAQGVLDLYAGGGWSAIGFNEPITDLTRPDGDSGFGQEQIIDLQVGFTEAQVNGWMAPRVRGTWTMTSEDMSTEQFDTTPLYRAAGERSYGLLTAASYALWNQILTTQTSGTFAFELTQSVAELGCTSVQMQLFGSNTATILSGRTFTINVDGAAASQGGVLLISGFGVRGSVTGTLGSSVSIDDGFMTVYSATIPAPGVLAFGVVASMIGRSTGHRRRAR